MWEKKLSSNILRKAVRFYIGNIKTSTDNYIIIIENRVVYDNLNKKTVTL